MLGYVSNLFYGSNDSKQQQKGPSEKKPKTLTPKEKEAKYLGELQFVITSAATQYEYWFARTCLEKSAGSVGWWCYHSTTGQERVKKLVSNATSKDADLNKVKKGFIEYFCEDSMLAKTRSHKHSYLAFLMQAFKLKPELVRYLNANWFHEKEDAFLYVDQCFDYHSDATDFDRDKALSSFRKLGDKTTFYLVHTHSLNIRCW